MAVQTHFAVLATVALYLILCAEVSASPPHDQPLTRALALALTLTLALALALALTLALTLHPNQVSSAQSRPTSSCSRRSSARSASTLKRVEMTAALGSGSAPPPSLPQPRPRAPRVILGSAPSRFEATSQPSSGPPKAADLRPNPLTGTRSTRAPPRPTTSTTCSADSRGSLRATSWYVMVELGLLVRVRVRVS